MQRPMNRRCNDMQQWSVWRHDEGRCVRISVELTSQRQSFDCEDRIELYSGLVQSGGAEGAPKKLPPVRASTNRKANAIMANKLLAVEPWGPKAVVALSTQSLINRASCHLA